MAKADNPQLPELPPIDDVLKLLGRGQETTPVNERKLSPEELTAQLKQHFGKEDLGKLVSALTEEVDFERATNCPILALSSDNPEGKIKIIKTRRGNNVVCPRFCKEEYISKTDRAYNICQNGCNLTYKLCPYSEAELF